MEYRLNFRRFEELICKDLIDNSRFNSDEERDQIMHALYSPITQDFRIGVEPSGVLDFKLKESGSRKTFSTDISSEHALAYCDNLLTVFEEYRKVVRGNQETNKFYTTPVFELDQAKKIAHEAFGESFKKTRDSYQVAYQRLLRKQKKSPEE